MSCIRAVNWLENETEKIIRRYKEVAFCSVIRMYI